MRALFEVIYLALDFYIWIIIASAVFSWLYAFNVVNMNNRFVGMIGSFLHQMTEPALRPIRRIMPNLGTIDISPIILIFGIFFLQRIIAYNIIPNLSF